MDIHGRRDLLALLKAVADENRLTMVGLLKEERTVGEMAGVLNLSEPTVSHHVSKLHEAGLLSLRMAGTHRFYRLNQDKLEQFKHYMNEIDSLPPSPEAISEANGWIEKLDWNEADKKVLRDYTNQGKLLQLPVKEKKWLVVLRWIAGLFEPDVRYSEKQINAMITPIHADYATIRRNLVEYGFMRRERGGGDYWLAPEEDLMP